MQQEFWKSGIFRNIKANLEMPEVSTNAQAKYVILQDSNFGKWHIIKKVNFVEMLRAKYMGK